MLDEPDDRGFQPADDDLGGDDQVADLLDGYPGDDPGLSVAVAEQTRWADAPGLRASFEPAGCCCYVTGADGGNYPVYGYDTDGDGIADAAAVDSDGDGVADQFYIDTNGDGAWDEIRDSAGNLIGSPQQAAPDAGGVQSAPAEGYAQPQPVEPTIDGTSVYPAPAGQDGQPQLVVRVPDGSQLTMPAVDADGDGVAESVAFDQNGDGQPDIWWADTTGNGVADVMLFDANGDGQPDTFNDPSETGQWTYVAPDGTAPAAEQPQPETVVPTAEQPAQPAEPSGVSSGDETGTFWERHFPGEPLPTDPDVGMQLAKIIARIEQEPNWQDDPELVRFHDQTREVLDQWNEHQGAAMRPWLSEQSPVADNSGALPEVVTDIVWSQTQSVDGFCVPVSVAMIVSEFRGEPEDQISEGEAVAAAAALGLIGPETQEDGTPIVDAAGNPTWTGMSAEGAARLLEHFQISAHVESGTLDELETFIAEGRSVIVAVDSDEIWETADDDTDDDDAGHGADHALQVKEIIQERDAAGQLTGNGVVVLFDPGHPDVPVREMDLTEFADAWADSNNQMIVTDIASSRVADIDTSAAEQQPAPEAQPQAPAEPQPQGPETQLVADSPHVEAPIASGPDDVPVTVHGEDAADRAALGGIPAAGAGAALGARLSGEFTESQQLRALGLVAVAGAVLVPVYLHRRRSGK